jgi:hypothetical protein
VVCRLKSLQLDNNRSFRVETKEGITCISVDNAEDRYALAAAQDGSIQCFDTLVRVFCEFLVYEIDAHEQHGNLLHLHTGLEDK